MLVFNGGEVAELANKRLPLKRACVCSFSTLEVLEVANEQPLSKASTRVLVFDCGEVVMVVANKRGAMPPPRLSKIRVKTTI